MILLDINIAQEIPRYRHDVQCNQDQNQGSYDIPLTKSYDCTKLDIKFAIKLNQIDYINKTLLRLWRCITSPDKKIHSCDATTHDLLINMIKTGGVQNRFHICPNL